MVDFMTTRKDRTAAAAFPPGPRRLLLEGTQGASKTAAS